jgi:RNase P subunit RPR2
VAPSTASAVVPPARRPALKGEDAWKRMNFLLHSANAVAAAAASRPKLRTMGLNLSRFYLQDMRRVASKLVLRMSVNQMRLHTASQLICSSEPRLIVRSAVYFVPVSAAVLSDPSVKNSLCKRCGVLLLPGLTARTEVDERAAHEPHHAEEEEATRSVEAERVRQWLLQQKQQRQQQRQQQQHPQPQLQGQQQQQQSSDVSVSLLPLAPSSAPLAASASIELPADAPSVSRPADGLNCKQRRAQRRAARSLDKLMATPLQPTNEDSTAIPAAGSAAAATAPPLTAAAATQTIDTPAPSVASSSPPVTPAAPADALAATPVAASLRGHRRKRKHKRQSEEPAEPLQREHKRKAHALAAKLPPPRVVRCCTECGTRRRINTKPPRAPAATE